MIKTMNKDSGEQLHVTMAIQRLQADLQSISSRLEALERHATPNGSDDAKNKLLKRSTVEQVGSFAVTYSSLPSVNRLSLPKWFPFKNMNLATILVILGWPFVAQYFVARLRHHRPSPAAI